MNRIKLHIVFNIAFLFLILPFGVQNQKASALAIQADFPPPPHLEPNASQSQNNGRINQPSTQAINPLNAEGVITNTFGLGDDHIHGLIYYNGSLWASTRTSPARILRINPSTLVVENRIVLTSGRDDSEDITAGQGYVWTITYTSPAQLIRVDPVTNTAQSAITFLSNELSFAASLKYAFGYLWAGGINHLVRIDITNPLLPTYQSFDFSSLVTQAYASLTALTYSNDSLWGVFTQYDLSPQAVSSTVIKINPSNPNFAASKNMAVLSLFPDDVTYAGTHFYISSENIPQPTSPSDIYKFDDSLTTKTTTHVSDSASYGTFLDPNDPTSFWGVYVNSPGKIIKFDPNPNAIASFNLPSGFNDPSEIAFDAAGNMYVSTWQIPSGIVKYTFDLGITKTASPNPAVSGQELLYTINVTNSSPVGVTNVVVTDTLPPEVSFLSSSPGLPTCSESNGNVTCNLGSLLANQNLQITIRVLVKASTSGKISNTATISSSEHDTNSSNNNVTLETQVLHYYLNLPFIVRK